MQKEVQHKDHKKKLNRFKAKGKKVVPQPEKITNTQAQELECKIRSKI